MKMQQPHSRMAKKKTMKIRARIKMQRMPSEARLQRKRLSQPARRRREMTLDQQKTVSSSSRCLDSSSQVSLAGLTIVTARR